MGSNRECPVGRAPPKGKQRSAEAQPEIDCWSKRAGGYRAEDEIRCEKDSMEMKPEVVAFDAIRGGFVEVVEDQRRG